MVFLEFLTMVENQFGLDMVDELIDATNPASGGAYTKVGSYPMSELVAMVVELSNRLNTPVPELLKAYGHYLFEKLAEGHPHILDEVTDPIDFLESIERHIHVEVRKLYPDANPPTFRVERLNQDVLQMDYISDRHLEDLAEGLARGCLDYFNVVAEISRTTLDDGTERFLITRKS